MQLYCDQHHQLHRFTQGEAERIIYALSAAYADELCDNDGTPGDPRNSFVGDLSTENNPCPGEVLSWAGDCEMYREHVDGCLESRRLAQHAEVTAAAEKAGVPA